MLSFNFQRRLVIGLYIHPRARVLLSERQRENGGGWQVGSRVEGAFAYLCSGKLIICEIGERSSFDRVPIFLDGKRIPVIGRFVSVHVL